MKIFSLILVIGVLIVGGATWFFMQTPGMEVTTDDIVNVVPGESNSSLPALTLTPHTVTFVDGTTATFRLPDAFDIKVAAEGLGKARFIAESPDGRLFIPDIVNYQLSHEGKIYILDDFDSATGEFETKHTYLSGLRGPNSIAFYTDSDGKSWIYLALTKNLLRYPYKAGDVKPSGEPEVIVEFPNKQTAGEQSVVWHITRTLLFHNDRLYIAIGSGCNSCEQPEGELRAMVASMDPDGGNMKTYADGLRNAVGIAWGPDGLYATVNGVDHLGEGRPDELMYKIDEGKQYGWPYCWESNGRYHEETPDRWERGPESCDEVPRPFSVFDPHSAPLGLRYFENAHPLLDDSFLVALHGSFEAHIRQGYQIVRVARDGSQQVFMDGFQAEADNARYGRPVDFFQRDENSFFFTDDHTGRVYYVYTR